MTKHDIVKQGTPHSPVNPGFAWKDINTILLDMDGTLLDKYFDDFFWEEYVPEIYGEKNNISITDARKVLLTKYKKVESTLEWTDLSFWSRELGLEIPELKYKVQHLIQVHPYVTDFLQFAKKSEKKLYLVTNAHCKSLELKLQKTPIGPYFDRIINSQEVGFAKEQPEFWQKLQQIIPFSRESTMLADDTEKVLDSARSWGIQHLIFIAKPSSRLPVSYSPAYPSITFFNELIF